jgi:hypothetical protein
MSPAARLPWPRAYEHRTSYFFSYGHSGKVHVYGPLGVLNESWQEALAWLTRRDIQERREDRRETVEWAILIWVIMGVIADIILGTRS